MKRAVAVRKTHVRGSNPYNQATERTMYAAKSRSFGLDNNSTTLNFGKTEDLQPAHTDIQIEENTQYPRNEYLESTILCIGKVAEAGIGPKIDQMIVKSMKWKSPLLQKQDS